MDIPGKSNVFKIIVAKLTILTDFDKVSSEISKKQVENNS